MIQGTMIYSESKIMCEKQNRQKRGKKLGMLIDQTQQVKPECVEALKLSVSSV